VISVRIAATDKAVRAKIRRAVLRHGLDRRKVYGLGFDGELATQQRCTLGCSGCSCDCHPGCSHGCGGCHECGYTGKRVQTFSDPVEIGGRYLQIIPSRCMAESDVLPLGRA
jgi:hypothetical protein